jgi:hypothetical protein
MIGQHIGKYRVVDRIGRGGMGTVYRATDETLRRDVAIKILNSELSDPEVNRRFVAEAVTVARLSHPGIARIYELFEHEGRWLMVMELIDGETLDHLVDRVGPLQPALAADVCIQALAAIGHAHAQGVIHRDLKPSNIMVNPAGAVVVMDFGIARVAGTEHLTNAGFMMGTPAYMAPEQVLGHEVDARADLYAMGVVLYRLLTAALPFKGETPFALAQAQVSSPPTLVATVRPEVPAWADQIIGRALAKATADRFQSATDFASALSRAVGGTSAGVTPPEAAPKAYAPTPPRPMPAASTDVTMLATPTPLATAASMASAPAGTGRSALSLFEAANGEPQPAAAAVSSRRPLWLISAAALVFLAGAGVLVLRSPSDAVDDTAASPATTAAPPPVAVVPSTPVAPEAQAAQAALPPSVPAPNMQAAPRSPAPAASAGTTGPPLPGAAPTIRPEVAANSGRAAMSSARRPGIATSDALLAVSDVRLLIVEGRKGRDEEVLLQLAQGRLSVVGRRSGTEILQMAYADVLGATYARARDPKWNPGFFAPPRDLDVGGMLRTQKHWLTLQGADSYVILRLEDSNVIRVIELVETRMALTVLRPPPDERN